MLNASLNEATGPSLCCSSHKELLQVIQEQPNFSKTQPHFYIFFSWWAPLCGNWHQKFQHGLPFSRSEFSLNESKIKIDFISPLHSNLSPCSFRQESKGPEGLHLPFWRSSYTVTGQAEVRLFAISASLYNAEITRPHRNLKWFQSLKFTKCRKYQVFLLKTEIQFKMMLFVN